MDKIILVYIQMTEGRPEPVSLELLGKARQLAGESGYRICGAAAAPDAEGVVKEISGYPLERLFLCPGKRCHDVNRMSDFLVQVCQKLEPEIVLIGATREGRSLAPCAAAHLGTGLTADCTELTMDENGLLIQIRPAFEERVLAHIKTRTKPQMATVRPGVMELPVRDLHLYPRPYVEEMKPKQSTSAYQVLSEEADSQKSGIHISKEKLLVVLGAGVKCREDIPYLKEWAESLGGTIACSRKLVERGWFTVERQIGLSGNASEAELMITVGLSGSVQFQAGIRKVKHIIAVNHDAEAPIMNIADEGILLDLNLMIRELKGRKGQEHEENDRVI